MSGVRVSRAYGDRDDFRYSCLPVLMHTYLSKVEVQNFNEIFGETDQDGIHAPVCSEVGCDDGPHGK